MATKCTTCGGYHGAYSELMEKECRCIPYAVDTYRVEELFQNRYPNRVNAQIREGTGRPSSFATYTNELWETVQNLPRSIPSFADSHNLYTPWAISPRV